jgi:protein O-GlcNAc transferase
MARHRRYYFHSVALVAIFLILAFFGCAAHNAANLSKKGDASLSASDLAQAEAYYRQSLEYEDSPDVRAQLGHTLTLENNCLEALQHLPRGLKSDSLKQQATIDLARCNRNVGNLPDAAERYVQAIEFSPHQHELSVETADLWPALYKDTRLKDWLNRLIAAQPDLHYGWAFLGNFYYDNGQLELARDAYQQALAIFPRSVPSLIRLGAVYALSRQSAKALESYDAALALDSEELSALYGKAAVLAQVGRSKAALDVLAAILDKAPEHAYANGLAAQIYLSQGKPLAALKHGKQAVKALPDNLPLVKLTARAAIAAGQPTEAVSVIDPVIARGSNDAELFEILGDARKALGENDSARQAYTRSITLNPQRPSAHIALGMLYFAQRIYAASAATLSEAARLAPENGQVWLSLGRSYVEMGLSSYAEAEKALMKATEWGSDNPDAWAYLAAVLVSTRRSDEGLSALEKAAQLGFDQSAFLEREDFTAVRPGSRFKMIAELVNTNEQTNFAAPDLVPLAPLPQ